MGVDPSADTNGTVLRFSQALLLTQRSKYKTRVCGGGRGLESTGLTWETWNVGCMHIDAESLS